MNPKSKQRLIFKSIAEDSSLLQNRLFDFAERETEVVIRHLQAHPDGFSEAEVAYRLQLHGKNEPIEAEKVKWYFEFLKTFKNPFIILLTIISVVLFATGDLRAGIVVSSMVLVSTILTFFQEFRSLNAAEKLKTLVSTKATVLRKKKLDRPPLNVDGVTYMEAYKSQASEVRINEIVPGDIMQLSAGDMIPADVRLITAKDLFISQSALTGETIPVEKTAGIDRAKNLLELKNICFMGTNVVSGTATAIAIRTGKKTYLGSIAKTLIETRSDTSFDKGIKEFSFLMIRFMLIMVPIVFLVNGFSKGDWWDAFMFAVAVAVGLTPEMLPMIVTVNLAKGALAMSKERVVVKKLSSIQNFGAMNVLCTDKTGTLTQDNVILERYVDTLGKPSSRVLKFAFLNSFHQTGLKNLLDIAVLKRAEKELQESMSSYKKLNEIPFDFSRRRMSVVVEDSKKQALLICKGALEEMVKISTSAEVDGIIVPLEEKLKIESLSVARVLNEDGMRVIAVGYKEFSQNKNEYSQKDESDLTLIGFVAFLDPPKETAAKAIQALRKNGVTVKVLTGDTDVVTKKVCRDVGIPTERIILGHEIDHMDENTLSEIVGRVDVFAKLSPSQKQKIIKAIRSTGNVVGFLGDGINDAPALRTADVGISVDTAVDIAKESSDIILLEKSLLVLERGVIEGRKVFGNIVKYIKMGASSNFGNVFSLIGASIFLPFLPMMPAQLLVQNLLYDLSQTAIPLDRVDDDFLEKPRKWEIGEIKKFMLFMGPLSSLFDYATFFAMWFVFKANTDAHQSLFQSGWFVEGLLSQTLIVHLVRTKKIPFIQSTAALPLILTTVAIMTIGIWIPSSTLGVHLGLERLPLQYYKWLFCILLAYAVCAQLLKQQFYKRFQYS